jgi:polysaccharide deacetylase family protein (PEP-CTERM system associated)
MPGQPITNALTIDVEDYFQVSALAPYIPRDQWHLRECRVERNVERILLMLEEQQTRATFFTLGWIAERYPHLVRCIVDAGHELASHGYGHQRASDLSEADFSADVGRAKKLLEDLSGQQVRGYRAPSFSIGEANLWAFDCLQEAGYCYSSSIYPIRHDHYGMPGAPRFAHRVLRLAGTAGDDGPLFSIATGRPAVAATSACCRMRCPAGCCRRSTSSMVSQRSSISIPGKSMPRSRALPVSVPRRVFATMSICSTPKAG